MGRLLVALMFVAVIHAADVTGTWTGQIAMTRGDETKDEPAYLVLKQSGAEITGTVGPNPGRRIQITKGNADGNDIYIEAIVEGENKVVLRLKVDGDKLTGNMKAEGPTAPPLSGKLTVSKEK